MSYREPSASSSGSSGAHLPEPDGAFPWLEPVLDPDPSPIIELSVADLEPDEADLALQDLLSDPDGALFDSAERAAYAAQFAAELLGDDEPEDLSDDPTLKIRIQMAEPEVDLDDWCNGFCGLGEVVAVAEQMPLAEGATRDSDPSSEALRDSFDPVWFTTTLPTRPPPPPRSTERRRAIGTIVASSVMTAGIVLAMVGFSREPMPSLQTARVGVASILDPGPSRSLESLASEGVIGEAESPEVVGTDAPVTDVLVADVLVADVLVADAPVAEDTATTARSETEGSEAVEPSAVAWAESLPVAELERMTLVHLDARELDAAVAVAEVWTTADPTDPRGYLCLGAALIDLGRVADAHRVLRTCVEQAKGPEVGECMAFAGRP